MVVDYFESHNASQPLDMEFLAAFSAHRCVNPCTLLVAMIYVNRMRLVNGDNATVIGDDGCNGNACAGIDERLSSELFLSALVLASKYLNDGGMDEFVWNDEFASASNFDIARINRLEMEMLDKLNWNLLVDEATFERAVDMAERWIAGETLRRNGFLTYNEINVFFRDCAEYMPYVESFVSACLAMIAAYTATLALLCCTFVLPFSTRQLTSRHENATVSITRDIPMYKSLAMESLDRRRTIELGQNDDLDIDLDTGDHENLIASTANAIGQPDAIIQPSAQSANSWEQGCRFAVPNLPLLASLLPQIPRLPWDPLGSNVSLSNDLSGLLQKPNDIFAFTHISASAPLLAC